MYYIHTIIFQLQMSVGKHAGKRAEIDENLAKMRTGWNLNQARKSPRIDRPRVESNRGKSIPDPKK